MLRLLRFRDPRAANYRAGARILSAWFSLFGIVALIVRAHGAELQAVQFSTESGNTQILLELGDPASFQASVNVRSLRADIVFDKLIVAARASAGPGFGLVRMFHTEIGARGQTHLVFDLAQPAIVAATRVLPPGTGKPAYAMIELEPADMIAMAAKSDVAIAVRPASVSGPRQSPSLSSMISRVGAEQAAIKPSSPPGAEPIMAFALQPTVQRVIVIDPGHGGIDPGADSVAGYQEKEITLAVARMLQRGLEATGRYRVLLTRTSDTYLTLRERVARARNAHGSLFVSLHADSMAGPLIAVAERSARGASVYTLSEMASDAETERYAQRENHADLIGGMILRDQSDDVADILMDLTMRETVNEGNRFAEILVQALEQTGVSVLPRAPHRSAGFAVLKSPDIPSVLVEMGYLSDIGEARDLAAPQYQMRIAQAISSSIDRYFAGVDAVR